MRIMIANKTTECLEVLGCTIKPGEESLLKTIFRAVKIKSGIGTCKVTTRDGQRRIQANGSLKVREGTVDHSKDGRKLMIYETAS